MRTSRAVSTPARSGSQRARDLTRALVMAATPMLGACDILGIGDDCTSNPAPVFTHMFTDLSQVRAIVPLGTPAGRPAGDSRSGPSTMA
jgi:hypothetical protein